jgi:hypothetical protein
VPASVYGRRPEISWRAIQSSTPHSETLAQVSDFAERLFWRMLSQADSWGRLQGSATKVRSRCIPNLDRPLDEVASAMDELVAAGRIAIYGEGGDLSCQLVDFDEHQPEELRRRRGLSRFPEPPEAVLIAARARAADIRRAATPGALRSSPAQSRGKESLYRPAVSRPPATGAGRENNGAATVPERFRKLAAMAKDADATSAQVWAIHADRLPASAIGVVEEELRDALRDGLAGERLRSPAGFVTARFKRLREERQAVA